VCPKCKEKYQVADNMKKYVEMAGINPDDLYRGTGCDYCRNSGYVGRIGLYELLVMDEHFRDMINKDPSVNNMRKVFRESGGKSLYEDGLDKVKKGLTTIEEVLRVTETDDPEQDASESEK
jgi:type II secretory ATPase GspE/PulE/Tfp pilus assembly ATPase PilB-like protein